MESSIRMSIFWEVGIYEVALEEIGRSVRVAKLKMICLVVETPPG